jgi:hypothetical protein
MKKFVLGLILGLILASMIPVFATVQSDVITVNLGETAKIKDLEITVENIRFVNSSLDIDYAVKNTNAAYSVPFGKFKVVISSPESDMYIHSNESLSGGVGFYADSGNIITIIDEIHYYDSNGNLLAKWTVD